MEAKNVGKGEGERGRSWLASSTLSLPCSSPPQIDVEIQCDQFVILLTKLVLIPFWFPTKLTLW